MLTHAYRAKIKLKAAQGQPQEKNDVCIKYLDLLTNVFNIEEGDPEHISIMSQICMGNIQLGQFKEATDMLRDISALVKENLSDDDPFYNELYTMYG